MSFCRLEPSYLPSLTSSVFIFAADACRRSLSAGAQSADLSRGSAPFVLILRTLLCNDNSAACGEVTLRRRNGALNHEEFPVSAKSDAGGQVYWETKNTSQAHRPS